jgi:hypothetical protein
MSERPTPETDDAQFGTGGVSLKFARRLERERDEAREAAMWKANHDNQVALKAMLMERPDLGDRASRIAELIRERDEAHHLLSRIARKGEFMDMEGQRLVVSDWLARRHISKKGGAK